MGPLITQTFPNDAADESGTFQSNGSPVTNAHASIATTFTVSYNATTQSYTVSTTGRTQTFAPADQVASGSTDFNAYQKSSGTTTDSLSLTVPGTSGALQYQYVGGGAWERATNNGSTLDFSYNPFTYGIVTPDANLARTGNGFYSVSLVGARESTLPFAMAGSGSLQVSFGDGNMATNGILTTINVSTGVIQGLGVFYGSAQLSSTTNAFSGTFAVDETGYRLNGGWQGRFYGPSNEEVGAVWYISNGSGDYGAGYLIGRTDNSVQPHNFSLTSLQFTEEFPGRFAELTFHDNGDGTAASGSTVLRSNGSLNFDASANSYTYVDANAGINSLFPSSSLNSGASNSSVAVYDISGGGTSYRLTLSKPGAGNPTIALNYVSFGRWQQFQTATTDTRDRWFAWGVRSNGFQIPTGSGHYDGILLGKGVTANNAGPQYDLTGTSTFDVNFGAATFTGSIHPIGTDLQAHTTRDFGTFAMSGGVMDVDGGLSANFFDGSNQYLGFFEGALYGPRAEEVGGSFSLISGVYPGNWSQYGTAATLTGVVVGKR